jgi:putative oxidoreductase
MQWVIAKHQRRHRTMTTLLYALGRILVATPFIRLGYDAARQPGARVVAAASIGVPEPELAVRVNGWTMVGAGAALALGLFPRLAALALVGSLIPTTAAGHAFWKEDEPAKRTQQFIHFLKNVSMIGALLLVVARRGEG